MASPAEIHVIAGAVRDANGRVLIAQRPRGRHMAGRWEFPGGKLDSGEDSFSGLKRELAEELGIAVREARPLIRLRYNYPDRCVMLEAWNVTSYEGEPQALDSQALAWARPDELPSHDLLEADRAIVTALRLPRLARVVTTLAQFRLLRGSAPQTVFWREPPAGDPTIDLDTVINARSGGHRVFMIGTDVDSVLAAALAGCDGAVLPRLGAEPGYRPGRIVSDRRALRGCGERARGARRRRAFPDRRPGRRTDAGAPTAGTLRIHRACPCSPAGIPTPAASKACSRRAPTAACSGANLSSYCAAVRQTGPGGNGMNATLQLLNVLRGLSFAGIATAACAASDSGVPQDAPDAGEPTLADVRAATDRFRDVNVALAEGYLRDPANLCDTAEMMGRPAELGAMGVHYFRPDLLGITAPPSPRVNGDGIHTDFRLPAILIYEPQADGSMELVAVENLVFASAWHASGQAERPSFHGVPWDAMSDDPATPVDEAHMFEPHYDRHVWIYRDNPNGVFAPFNPAVSCHHHQGPTSHLAAH